MPALIGVRRPIILPAGSLYPLGATPLALPFGAGIPLALYSVVRPLGYIGPCLRLVRVSDSAQRDIGWNALGFVDSDAALAWANGSALKITTAYDKSGRGNHATQTTLANMPDFTASSAQSGIWPMAFSGANGGIARYLTIPSNVTYDESAMSLFMGVNPTISMQNNAYFEAQQAGASKLVLYTQAGGSIGFSATGAGYTRQSNIWPRSQPNVIGFTSNTTAQKFYVQGQEAVAAASPTNPLTGGMIGMSLNGAGYNLRSDVFGFALYGSTLSTADANAVVAAMNSAYAMPTSFTARIILDGNSILEGYYLNGGSGVGSLQNWVRQMTGLKGAPEIFNMGISGQTFAQMLSNQSRNINPLVTGTSLPVVVGFEGGTNDLNGTTTDAQLKNTAGDYVKAMRSTKAAAKIVGQTLLPRNTLSTGNGKEAYRQSYNSYIAGKSVTATDGTVNTLDDVADVASETTVGPYAATSNTSLYPDGTHPSVLGDSYIAPVWSGALNRQLP